MFNLLDFREDRARLLYLLNFFDQASLVGLAPIVCLKAMLKLTNSPLQLGLIVVYRVHTSLNFLQFAIHLSQLFIDALYFGEAVFFLLIVLVELTEELAELLLDRVTT